MSKHILFLIPLILRRWSRPWAGPWTGGWTFLPWLGSAAIFLWGWWAWGRFGDTLLLPVLHWRSWTTAGLLFTRHLLGSTARIPLWLYLWTTLWTGLGFPVARTGWWFAGAWTRFGFAGAWAGPAVARTWLAFSRLGTRLPSRSGAGMMASLVATGTRPGAWSGATPGAPASVASATPAAGAAATARSGAAARVRPPFARPVLH